MRSRRLLLNSLLGWAWADSVAALAIAVFAVREGVEAWRVTPVALRRFRRSPVNGRLVRVRTAVVDWASAASFRVPPVALMLGALGAQRLLAGKRSSTGASRVAATGVAAAAGWLIAGSVVEFRRVRTTVNPVDVDAATLVTSGPNRITRNPMYLGMAGILTSHAIYRRRPAALVPLALFVVAIDRFQIPVEEAKLRERFGDEYEAYARRTRRWLGSV